jgi:hypothetical protein
LIFKKKRSLVGPEVLLPINLRKDKSAIEKETRSSEEWSVEELKANEILSLGNFENI